MPEENFEQQARRKIEAFGMEPNSNVWPRVKEAIAPAKRRRRLLLWWWLLPLCVAGVVTVWLAGNKMEPPQNKVVAKIANSKNVRRKSEPQPVLKSSEAMREQTSVLIKKKNSGTTEKKTKKDVAIIMHNVSGGAGQYKIHEDANQSEPGIQVTTNQQMMRAGKLSVETDNNINKITPVIEQPQPDAVVDSNNNAPSFTTIDSTDGKNSINRGTGIFIAKDSATHHTAADKTVATKKENKKKKWQVGVSTELGLASWGKNLLTNGMSSDSVLKSFPSSTTATTIDSLLANTSEVRKTKNGVDVGAGLVVRKEVGNHFYITGQLGYRYQQYTVYGLRQAVLQQPNMLSSLEYLVNTDHYRAHFLNLTVSVGKYLFTNKRNALSAEAGLDNGLLVLIKKGDVNPSSSDFNLNKNLRTNDFYRWQPHLMMSLPFDWHSGDKMRFLLSPFARFGFHDFQKEGDGFKNNHLMSAGVQAIYFFK